MDDITRLESLRGEIIDDFDEEFELELGEEAFGADVPEGTGIARRTYFRKLFELQHELVRLQDWVQASGARIVVIFEGRDFTTAPGSSA